MSRFRYAMDISEVPGGFICNPYLFVSFQESAESFLRNAIPGADTLPAFNSWAPEFGKNVVRMVLSEHVQTKMATRMKEALTALGSMLSDLTYDFVDLSHSQTGTTAEKMSFSSCGSDKLLEALNLIIYVMQKSGRRYSAGTILSKDERSTASYTQSQTIRQYVNELCQVDSYRTVLTTQIERLVKFFEKNPDYGGITSIKIDLNLIEVCVQETLMIMSPVLRRP